MHSWNSVRHLAGPTQPGLLRSGTGNLSLLSLPHQREFLLSQKGEQGLLLPSFVPVLGKGGRKEGEGVQITQKTLTGLGRLFFGGGRGRRRRQATNTHANWGSRHGPNARGSVGSSWPAGGPQARVKRGAAAPSALAAISSRGPRSPVALENMDPTLVIPSRKAALAGDSSEQMK